MSMDKLFFNANILIKDEELTLLPDGIFLWNRIIDFLRRKFDSIHYNEIYTNDLFSYVNKVDCFPIACFNQEYKKDEIRLVSYGKYLNEIEECRNSTIDILQIYNLLGKELLAIPFLMGKLPLNQNKNMLTTYLGNKDAEASYLGKMGEGYINHSTISSNVIFTLLNIHRDELGLVIPPRIAPHQIAIVPLKQNEKGVLKECKSLYDQLVKNGYRVSYNDSNKISSIEKRDFFVMSGIPLIIEIGPRDLERNVVEIITRDNMEKLEFKNNSEFINNIDFLLDTIYKRMYRKVLVNNICKEKLVIDKEELNLKDGVVKKINWCGDEECLKNKDLGVNFISFNQQLKQDKCLFCSKKSKYIISIIKN